MFLAAAALIVAAAPLHAETVSKTRTLRIVQLTGDVKVLPRGLTAWRAAKINERIKVGWKLRSGASSSATLEHSPGNRIRIGEKTEIQIDTSRVVYRDSAPTFTLELSQSSGNVLSVFRKFPPQSNYRLRTPVSVVAVRGTVFSSALSGSGRSLVQDLAVTEGQVSLAPSTGRSLTVGAGKKVKVTSDGAGAVESLTAGAKSSLNANVAAAEAKQKCVNGVRVHNGTARDISITLKGEGVYTSQRVPAKSDRTFNFKATPCVTATVTGQSTGQTSSTGSVADYAARLKARNQPQTAPTNTTPQPSGQHSADATGIASGVSDQSRASYEEEKRREAEEAARANAATTTSSPNTEYQEGHYPGDGCCPAEETAPTSQPSTREEPPPPVTPPPTSDAGHNPPPRGEPIEPGQGIRFSERVEICGTGKVSIVDDVDITPLAGDCVDEPDGEGDEDGDDGHGDDEEADDDPRDADEFTPPPPPEFDEEWWEELLEAWRKAKEEEDRRIREELQRLEDEMKEKQKAIDEERERRRRHPERGRNAEEKERIDRERERLEEERDKIEEERDRLDREGKTDDQLDKDLRKAEQEERERDPNCRGAACRQIQEERTRLQERRVERMKEGQQVEKRSQAYDRDARELRNDAADLENRLDRGEGLTREEHRLRIERNRAEAARQEYEEKRARWTELNRKANAIERGPDGQFKAPEGLTREEAEEFRELNGLNWDGAEKQLEKLELDAMNHINEAIENGGTFSNHADFFSDMRRFHGPAADMKQGPSFDNMSSDELKERSDRLGRAIESIDNAQSRVGQGGDQAEERRAGIDAMDKAKAEIDAGVASLDAANARTLATFNALHGSPAANGAKQALNTAREELEKANAEGRPYSERQVLEERLRDAERDFRQAERAHRAAERDAQELARNLNDQVDLFNDVTRHEAMADQASNLVRDYNSSFGNTITPNGQLNPDALRDNFNRFEQNAREAREQAARIGALEEMKQGLRTADGHQTEGQRLGLSENDIRRHEETLDRQMARAAERRDAALSGLERDGFQGGLGPDGTYRVTEAPNWARVFGQATKIVIADEKAAQERLARQEAPQEPALERPRHAERLSPEMREARDREGAEQRRVAMEQREREARERNEAALEGGYDKWREVNARQRAAELERLRVAPEVNRERITKLEGESQREAERDVANRAREERMNRVWEGWAKDVVSERRYQQEREAEARRPVTPVAPRTEAPSQLEVERNQRLDEGAAALTELARRNDVEALRERRDKLERDYMDNQAARLRGEREANPNAERLQRLEQQGERIMEQIEAYRLSIVRAHEHRTESANEADHRRALEQAVEWDQVRRAVPAAPVPAQEPVRVAQAPRAEGQQESPRRTEPVTPPPTTERPRPPVTPQPEVERPRTPTTERPAADTGGSTGPPPRPESTRTPGTVARGGAPDTRPSDTSAAQRGIERPVVRASDDPPSDTRGQIATDSDAAARAAREAFKDFVRRTLGGLLERSDPTIEVLPEIISTLADRYGAENAAKLVVDALARLRDRRSIRGVDVLNALFEQSVVESERRNGADGKRLAQFGHLEFLDSLLNDPRLAIAFGITPTQRQAIVDRIRRIATEASRGIGEQARAAERAGNLAEELKHLSNMLHLANLKGAAVAERNPIIRRISEIQARLLERGITNPQEALGVATSSAEALRGALARLPENATEEDKTAIVEELIRAQRLRRLAAQQIARIPGQAAVARIIELEATTSEARALVGLNRVGEALTLLRGLQANSPAEIAIKAQALAPILALAERIHTFVAEGDRATFGTPEALRAERKRLLDDWLRVEEDEDAIAAIALERAALGEALATLNAAIERAPENPILRGVKLVTQITQLSAERPAGEIARLVNEVPADLREAALAIALNNLGANGDLRALDALRAVLAQPAFGEMRTRLEMRERLARVDALSRNPSEANDAEIDRIVAEARGALDGAGFDEATKATIATALGEVERGRRAVRDLIVAANGENAPPEGWNGLARQALQAGRLDLAERALEKQLRSLAENADRTGFIRGVSEVVGLMNLVRARAEDPSLTDEQRALARGFLQRVGTQVAGTLDGEIATTEVSVARLARNNQSSAGTATEAQKARAAERMHALVDDLRALARMRGMARIAGMPDAERANELGRMHGEVEGRIRDVEAEIRRVFGGQARAVEGAEMRTDLEEKIGQLNALRAERDAYRDLMLARAGTAVEYRYILYHQEGKNAFEWELFDLDRRLNGAPRTENEAQTYGVRGRWRGASGWRKFSELRGDDRDRQLDKILLENEIQYLEQRRFDLVMEAPHLTRDQKRAMYEQILRTEAGLWQAAGENVSPLLFPELSGLGQAEIALARAQVQAVEQMRLRNLESDYNEAKKRGDPQAAFDALVRIREASLAGEIDKYVDYLNVPWYRRGPVRGVRVGLYSGETGRTLEELSAEMSQLHSALIRASHRPVNQLTPEDKVFLTERGFIVNGRYAIPEGIELKPTRVATELADEGRLAVIDKYVNAAFAAELAATVVIPGGISARLAGGTLTRVALAELVAEQGLKMGARNVIRSLATREGAKWLAAWGGERAIEAAFFTALSRGARTALNPEMILDENAWSLGGLSKEYLHNLAVIGTLRVGGGSMGLGREAVRRALGERVRGRLGEAAFQAAAGTATALGEAALLTGLNRAFGANAITADDFIGNLLTIGMLRGMHVGQNIAGEGRTGQIRGEMEAYNRWLDAEFLPARRLMNQFDGNWDALRGAYQKGTITENQMRQVFELRRRIIDELAREIVNEIRARGTEADVQAFGSSNLTSDYDLSFIGPKAELAVILFNARFNARWSRALELGGSESATRLDVNFYTNPIFDAFRGGPDDVFNQDAFAHMAARKYMNDAQWAEHRQRTLEATRPELRERLSARFDEIERSVRRATGEISALEAQIRTEMQRAAGEMRGINEADVGWAARNRLYENALREIIRLKEAYDRATTEAGRAEIAQQLRNAQSDALYFAAEAYQTDAAIKHVVFTIQAARRAITVEGLMGRERPELTIPLTEAQGRQSYFEQMANIYKEFNHHGNEFKLAGKTAKYFIRALDAARIAGLEFTPEMRDLVEATVHIDGIRADAAAVEAYLKGKYGENGGQEYMNRVERLMGQLGGQLAGRV